MTAWHVSVIVPVFNGAAFIAEALDSIVQQCFPALEIIVVDDGSTDETASIVEQHPAEVRYHYQHNQGPQHARNRGLEMACGNAVAFLDSDDIWTPDKLAIQSSMLDHSAVVIGHTKILGEADAEPFILPSLCCALFRISAFEQVGGFDPELEYSDDMDWYQRARESDLQISLHKDVVLHHRRHANNLTKNIEKKERFHLLMLHKSIKRRREQGIGGVPLFSDFLEQGAE